MLDGNVVNAGQGRRAFRSLRDRFRHLGVLRSGVDLDRMLDLLREDEFDLVVDAGGSVAAQRLGDEGDPLVVTEGAWRWPQLRSTFTTSG